MWKRILTIIIVFGLVGFMQLPCQAGKVKPLNIDTITQSAGVIFQGKCIDVRSGRDSESGFMATWYTFRVDKGIKGKLDETFVLKQFGGTEDDRSVLVPNVGFEKGEKVVVFLYGKSRIGFSSAVGMHQGKFVIDEIKEKKVKTVSNGMPAMVLFEGMDHYLPTVNEKGVRTKGSARLQANNIELDIFLDEIERLVKEHEKKKEK